MSDRIKRNDCFTEENYGRYKTIGKNKYKCKKAEYNYDSATNKINFSGNNFTGSYSVSSN